MKRFGGFEFFPEVKRSVDLLSTTTINRILNLFDLATNSSSSTSTIDAEKIASLLRVNPSQVAVSLFFSFSSSSSRTSRYSLDLVQQQRMAIERCFSQYSQQCIVTFGRH